MRQPLCRRPFSSVSIIVIFLIFKSLLTSAQLPFNQQFKREMRAVWLTTIGGLDWPNSYSQSERSIEKQKEELRTLFDYYQKAGINTILIQTRIRGTVIYPSAYEPWDGCLSGIPGKSPGYDALKFAIDEAHLRGMELHAWVVTIPVGKWNALGCNLLRKHYPRLIKKIGQDGYMNPEKTETANYLADISEEITKNYDIDGIHLDYIRYPENWPERLNPKLGREYITNIVRQISNRVRILKPWVKISCSPIGKFDDLSRYWSHGWNAYTKVCQDAQGWLKEGLMDALFPMMYFRDEQFFPFAIDWAEQSNGKIIAPGLGIYLMAPNEKNWPSEVIKQEMNFLRQLGLGYTFFRGKFLTDNLKGIFDFVSTEFNTAPALVPAMTWIKNSKPNPPSNLIIRNGNISWQASSSEPIYFNIYSSRNYPVDVEDGRNLMRVRFNAKTLQIPIDPSLHYAVTAMDRYGNESVSLQEKHADIKQLSINTLQSLKCDGYRLQIPSSSIQFIDGNIFLIESLQGSILMSQKSNDNWLNIHQLPSGVYLLKSLNNKGISHRLGFFQIRRSENQ